MVGKNVRYFTGPRAMEIRPKLMKLRFGKGLWRKGTRPQIVCIFIEQGVLIAEDNDEDPTPTQESRAGLFSAVASGLELTQKLVNRYASSAIIWVAADEEMSKIPIPLES